MKKLTIIQKVLEIIVALFLLIFLSEKFHELIQNKLTAVCCGIITYVLMINYGIGFMKNIIEAWQTSLSKRTRKLFLDIKETARVNIIHYVDKGGKLHLSAICQLMIIYQHDTKSYSKFLNMLVQAHDEDDRNKKVISYIMLSSFGKSEVAIIFEKRPELKEQCENLSKEIVDFVMRFDFDENEINKELIIGLLHSSLPGANLCKDKVVYLLRGVSSWLLKKQSDVITNEEENIMVTVAMLFPLIKNKLQNSGICDDYITKGLAEIENSKWFRKALRKSYKYVDKSLDNESDNLLKSEEYIKHICMVYTYYDRLSLTQREKLYYKVKHKKRELRRYLESDKKMLLLVLCTSSMKELNKDEDLLYQLASIASSCAEQFMRF